MRLFMQNKPAESETPRYYQIDLTQDLLGGWTLYREWSQNGGRISSKRGGDLEGDTARAESWIG